MTTHEKIIKNKLGGEFPRHLSNVGIKPVCTTIVTDMLLNLSKQMYEV